MPITYKQQIKTLISVLVTVPVIGFASSPGYLCHHGEQSREILVQYDVPGQSVPCGVLYRKASGEQELWRANDEDGYCEARAREFAAKQESWGWQCSELNPSSSVVEAGAPVNDGDSANTDDVEDTTEDAVVGSQEAPSEKVEAPETTDEATSEPINDAANLL